MSIQTVRHVEELTLTFSLSSFWSGALALDNRVDFSPLLSQTPLNLSSRHNTILSSAKRIESQYPFITIIDDSYPQILASEPFAPPVLFYRGSLNLLKRKAVAIVGSRHCSKRGSTIAQRLSQALCEGGHCTISGLAYGIDESAHRGNLAGSIGVLAQGFETSNTPRMNALCKEILEAGGLLLSPFQPKQRATRWGYLQRNRIIAWLAQCSVIVEATESSGTFNTVRHTVQANRQLLVVPWDPLHPSSSACLHLMVMGANPIYSLKKWRLSWGLPSLLNQPLSLKDLHQKSLLTQNELEAVLMLAIQEGWIEHQSDGLYHRIHEPL